MAQERVSDWGSEGYSEYECEIETTSDTLATKMDTELGKCVFDRDKKGNIVLHAGWFYGVLRDSGRYLGISGDGLVHSGMTRIAEDDIRVITDGQKIGEIQKTGTPKGGRGVVSIHEVLPVGTMIRFNVILPKVTHKNEKIVRQHLELAGRYCGLGAWRPFGSGRFVVTKIKKMADIKPIKVAKVAIPEKADKKAKSVNKFNMRKN